MKCQSCGAPVAHLDRSGRYVCDYCETEAVAKALADSVDKLVLTGTQSEVACPSCNNGNRLETGSLDDQPILGCRRCQGIWLRRDSYGSLVHGRRATYSGPDRTSDFDLAVDGPRDHHSRLSCPHCRSKMESFFYAGPGRVAIDTCDRCERVWLDCGELTRIAEAPGLR
jgi:Zn-finger nucleic acid-binding protein